MNAQILMFDGPTFDPALDGERLWSQLEWVRNLMLDGKWRTLANIQVSLQATGNYYSEAGISARLRDLRKERFGGYTVERRRVENHDGLHEYRILL